MHLIQGSVRWLLPRAAAIILVGGTLAAGSPPLAAQQLPGGATPGAVLPRLNPPVQAPPPPASLFEIPRVADRPLGIEEGPRLQVKSFKLVRAVDRPARGVKVADVQALLDQARASQPAEGYTVNQLQGIAAKVADYYHSKGLILAQAFVPQQTVRDGVVEVEVLEGALNSITVEGNKSYSTRTLLRPFNGLVGSPVEKNSIESALLTLADYPGLTAYGVLGAGRDVGATNLTLRVQSEKRLTFDTSFDNDGSRFAGEYRLRAGLTVNNPLGDADYLKLYGLYGFDTADHNANGAYGGFEYAVPLFSPRDQLLLSYATDAYNIGNVPAGTAASQPKGNTGIGEVAYRHAFAPDRLGSMSVGLALDIKRATFQLQGQDKFKDDLTNLRTDFAWDRIDTKLRGVNQLSLAYTHGFKSALGALGDYDPAAAVPPSRVGATGDFNKVTLSLQRLQHITTNTSLLLRVQGQQSSDPLVSLEQFTMSGADAVRAYPVADSIQNTGGFLENTLVDKGVLATGEYIFGVPFIANRPAFRGRSWGQTLQFSLFADYASGRLNPPAQNNVADSVHIGGWGGSVQFNVPGHVFARVDVATPFDKNLPASNGRDPQYFFRLGASF